MWDKIFSPCTTAEGYYSKKLRALCGPIRKIKKSKNWK